MAAVRSLFRRALRVAGCCVEEHRAWAGSYVRMRFRDDAVARGGGTVATARQLREGEDELQRMVRMLQHAGRLGDAVRYEPDAARASAYGSTPASQAAARGTAPPREWDEATVGEWLESIGLGQHAPAFARRRVDGRLLLLIDDEDLASELGVASRLERKRVLSKVEELRPR